MVQNHGRMNTLATNHMFRVAIAALVAVAVVVIFLPHSHGGDQSGAVTSTCALCPLLQGLTAWSATPHATIDQVEHVDFVLAEHYSPAYEFFLVDPRSERGPPLS